MKTLEVLFTPADFGMLKQRPLGETTCVVFDIFRATTSMIAALANGAAAVIPVGEIPEALAIRKKEPGVLLAGEREGLRIGAALTGGVDFDLGNSPREFTRDKVAGKTIAMTTTNGTRALRSCAHAEAVLVGSFLNLRATADFLRGRRPSSLLIICSGTFEQASYEDALAAGALCDLLWNESPGDAASDSAKMAREIFRAAQQNLSAAAAQSRNGRRLSAIPELRDDVPFSLRLDICNIAAVMNADGKVRRV